jgi:hypothetical protein
MSGIVIDSAYYGDEKSFSKITDLLTKKIAGGVLEVTADSSLKPTFFDPGSTTSLDASDEKRIREQSVKACGGEADQACLERTRIKLSEERLREKETQNLTKSVIKGDRLTINILDNGRPRKLVTPAGQKLRLENVIGGKNVLQMDTPSLLMDKSQEYILQLLTIAASTFFWVFGIVAPYAVFMREYEKNPLENDQFRIAAYASAATSVLFPGAGYLIVLGYYGFTAFIKEYIAKE